MNKLREMYDSASSSQNYADQYVARMAEVLLALDTKTVAEITAIIEKTAADDKTVFFAGNGGSAAVGTHWVNDLSANTVVDDQPGFRCISLTDNASSLTALANDASFEKVFTIQLKANMRPGDVVIFMSVSGNSPNIVDAVEYANANGAITIGCTGFEGGKVKELVHHSVHMPSTKDEYGPIEDMFSVIMHIAQSYISMNRGRYLAH
ncbi:MAG: SIS domain-containing protein [Candidatus Hydrogenedentota bacterium]